MHTSSQPSVCIVCGQRAVQPFIELPQVPAHCNLLWPTQSSARQAPRGDLHLGFCSHCGHIFNLAFDPRLMEYSQDYENSLHFSPRFQQYAEGLADHLVARYDLHHKDILEIGSGQGDFLEMLCERGENRGVGFDPSYVPALKAHAHPRTTYIQDFYGEQYASYPADFIISRHVFEHIEQPAPFLALLRRVIGERRQIVVFFEVPNVLYTLRQLGIWDLIYEHPSYFSPHSLAAAFQGAGFRLLEIGERFGGQFLTIESAPVATDFRDSFDVPGFARLAQDVAAFGENYRQKVQLWRERLEQFKAADQRLAVWGVGSKGVTFLNVLASHSNIEHVIDLNPRKHGMFVAGSGQEIHPPEFLRDYRPEVVLIMNANYEQEIRATLEGMGLAPQIFLA